MQTRSLRLKSGKTLDVTVLGAGSAPLGNLYRALDDETAIATLDRALEAGCNYFDTAPLYGLGLAERRLGEFLRRRKPDVVVSTKVGRLMKLEQRPPGYVPEQWFGAPSREIVYDYTYDGVMRSFEFSLERLGLDRFDIVFCHDIDVFTHGTKDASMEKTTEFLGGGLRALTELRDAGLIDAFGLGVNEWEVCQYVAERADVDVFLLAGRYTLLEQEANRTFLPMCEDRGIGIMIGGAFNSGILATGARAGATYNYKPAPPHILDKVARIERVCADHDVSIVDAAIQFPLGHPATLSVVAGVESPEQMDASVKAITARIPVEFWYALKREKLVRDDAPLPTS